MKHFELRLHRSYAGQNKLTEEGKRRVYMSMYMYRMYIGPSQDDCSIAAQGYV